MKRLLVIALVVTLAATSGWLWRSLEQERERSDRLLAESVRLRKALNLMQETPPSATPALQQNSGPRGKAKGDAMSPRIGFMAPGDDQSLLSNKDYVGARIATHKAVLANEYSDLAQALDISQGVVEQLIAIKAREIMSQLDMADSEDGSEEDAVREWRLRQSTDADLAALIGENKLRKFKEYESSLLQRQFVKEVQLELLDSPEPLGRARSEELVSAFYQAQMRFNKERATMPRPLDINEEQAARERELITAAETVLSPIQLKSFREMLDDRSRVRKASQEALRLQLEFLRKDPKYD